VTWKSQLPTAVEQVEQRRLAVRSVEDVLLVDPDHRESAAIGVQPVASAGELLLLGEQPLASGQPLVTRRDVRQVHRFLPSWS
jgi:hypothetical protein